MTLLTICILASGNISSNKHPRCKYSFSSIVTIRTESSGFNNRLAIFSRFSIIDNHLLCR